MKNYWKYRVLKEFKDQGLLPGKTILYSVDKDKVIIYDYLLDKTFKIDAEMMMDHSLYKILTNDNVEEIYSVLPEKVQKKFWDYFYNSYSLREREV